MIKVLLKKKTRHSKSEKNMICKKIIKHRSQNRIPKLHLKDNRRFLKDNGHKT
jgi:hypothetical protein